MRIVLVGEAGNYRARLSAQLAMPHEIATAPPIAAGSPDFNALADGADVVVTLRLPRLSAPLDRLRLLHVPGAGLDGIDFASIPRDAWVCNVFEHEGPIAEFVLMAVLHWSIGLDALRASFTDATWPSVYRARTPHREIAGQTLGLIGYGRIGRAIAARAACLGMRVLAVDAGGGAPDPAVQQILPPDSLEEMLRQADFVAIACPLNQSTKGMLAAPQFAAMQNRAVLINISRAEIADEAALYDALRDKQIAGAYLDVWYQYPGATTAELAPASRPFLALPNVVATPHSCAWTEGLFERRWKVIADNITRLHNGEKLRNVVRPAEKEAAQ